MSVTDDIVAIQMLKSEYVFAVDERRWDDLLAICTDDIVVDGSVVSGTVWSGKAQVRASYEQYHGDIGAVGGSPGIAHITVNPLIRVTGDTATGKYYFVPAHWGWDPDEHGVGWHGVGLYEEDYVRDSTGWKIKRIVISFHYRADTFPKGQELLDTASALQSEQSGARLREALGQSDG
jgi:SnoaL-like domain